MICVICKQGSLVPGRATVTFTRPALTLVVRNVPARICENCGEEYFDEHVTSELLNEASKAESAGVEVAIREYSMN